MRLALCLHGLSGGYNSKGRKIKSEEGFTCFKEFLLDSDIDVFMHSWTVGAEDRMVELYKPKRYVFEKQRKFEEVPKGYKFDPVYYQNMQSMCYSYKVVNDLKRMEEKEGGFEYDLVIHSRFDLWIGLFCDLSQFRRDRLYFLKYHNKKLLDHMWIGGSKVMDKFCEIYDCIRMYLSGLKVMRSNQQFMNHDLIMLHLKRMGLYDKLEHMIGLVEAGTFPQK